MKYWSKRGAYQVLALPGSNSRKMEHQKFETVAMLFREHGESPLQMSTSLRVIFNG